MPYSYQDLISLPVKEKLSHLSKNEKIYHVIFAEQFNRDTLDRLCRIANVLRKIAQNREGSDFLLNLLSHKSVMLFFTQPSTRTYLSFVRACQYLGMRYANVRDPSISSFSKGESDTDGVMTFSNYFDLIIMRHHEGGFAERIAYLMNDTRLKESSMQVPVISAGAGPDEHPTQALLDIYTLHRSFERRPKGMDGLHVAFMGDVARGRTVRSLSKLLTRYNNIKMSFISPPELRIKEDLRKWLDRKRVEYNETSNLNELLKDIDVIYVTRIQDEYDTGDESKGVDYTKFHLKLEHVKQMKDDAIVMHPLPRRQELDPMIDFDKRAKYWEQEVNGMWARAALVAYVFNADSSILDYYSLHHGY